MFLTSTILDRKQDPIGIVTETSAADGLGRFDADDLYCTSSDHDMPGMDGLDVLEEARP